MLIIHALLDSGNNITNWTSVVSCIQKHLREHSQIKQFEWSQIH